MLKKSLFVAGGVALLLGLFFGRDAISYVTTSVSQVHQSVKDSVPVDFEIKRARKMIKNIDPEIRRCMHQIAKEAVQVDRLAQRIESLEENLQKDENGIMKLKDAVDSGDSHFYFAGHRYSATQVKADLANRFERYKTNDATLAKLHKVLHARKTSLDAAKGKLDGMVASKRQLEVEVENLEARLRLVEVAQTTSDFNFDDSHLARTRELINDLSTRIDVAERMVDNNSSFQFEIPVEESETETNISEEITQYFDAEHVDYQDYAVVEGAE